MPRGSWISNSPPSDGVVGDAAVAHVVGRRPEGAGMGVELVALAVPVDVGPGVHPPLAVQPPALAVGGQLVGEALGDRQHLLALRPAPFRKVVRALPAAPVRALDRGHLALAREDPRLQRGVDARPRPAPRRARRASGRAAGAGPAALARRPPAARRPAAVRCSSAAPVLDSRPGEARGWGRGDQSRGDPWSARGQPLDQPGRSGIRKLPRSMAMGFARVSCQASTCRLATRRPDFWTWARAKVSRGRPERR